jgi:glutamate-1-semialdehyde 2,1-aminomutase
MHRTNLEIATPVAVRREVGLGFTGSAEISRRWFERAKKSLAGGISSSARSTTCGDLPYPLYMVRGEGSRVWDADGHQFIDYLLGYGSSVLGHADDQIVKALSAQASLGTMFGTCNTLEVELAELICQMVPAAKKVRFANSGSEAMCGAVRAARGFTGKNKILKFEGHYHGWVDVLAVSNRPTEAEAGPNEAPRSVAHSRGTPEGVVSDVIICPWNSPETLIRLLDEHQGELAAVVAEPIVANNACLMPKQGYLELLREECWRRKLVLIFDEIVTGFRMAPGGAQEITGVIPDIAVFAKALGGGMPLAAFAGKSDIMEPIAANVVKHGGTYNGNPMCVAAGLATLRRLANRAEQESMRRHGEMLMDSAQRAARDCRVACIVQGLGSMFQVIFAERQPENYRDLYGADMKRFSAFRHALLERGLHINNSGMACWFVSAAHTDEDAQLAGKAIEGAMKVVAA